MKKIFNKKLISGILLFFIFFTSSFAFFPAKKAEAQWTDFTNLVVNTYNSVKSAVTSIATIANTATTYLSKYKEFVLDPLAWALAKAIIQQLTASVVDWINSGFEGSPSFVQDPGGFFLDLADQMTGEFISQNGPLSSLCSPFSIDLRIALAYKYHPKGASQRYTCTLSTIINNSKNAIENASINGFTAGDFRQGGWPAFVSMTTEPQNNIYGAYLEADNELSLKVANIQLIKQNQLNQGSGFLSFPDPSCVKKANALAATANSEGGGDITTGSDANLITFDDNSSSYTANKASCPTVTPGSVISSSLSKQLGAGTDTLVSADEISEIVNALIAQLVTQVLGAGLKAVSQKDSSGTSYLEQTVNDINNAQAIETMKASAVDNMTSDISNTKTYRDNAATAVQYINTVNDKYIAVKSCYEAKISAVPVTLSNVELNIANIRLQNIISILAGDLAATTTRLTNIYQSSINSYNTLQQIQTDINAATTTLGISSATNSYARLMQNNLIPNEMNISDSTEEIKSLKVNYASAEQDANAKLIKCQGFPANLYDSNGNLVDNEN